MAARSWGEHTRPDPITEQQLAGRHSPLPGLRKSPWNVKDQLSQLRHHWLGFCTLGCDCQNSTRSQSHLCQDGVQQDIPSSDTEVKS